MTIGKCVLAMTEAFACDVFASKDKPGVRELAERLKRDGLRVWLDEWVIQPGESIPLAVEQGLESSRTLVRPYPGTPSGPTG